MDGLKNVLICDRPSPMGSMAPVPLAFSDITPFIVKRVSSPLGLNSTKTRQVARAPPQKLQAHKLLIRSMDDTLRFEKENQARCEIEEEGRKKKFSESQSDLRRKTLGSRDKRVAAEIYQSEMDKHPNDFARLMSSFHGTSTLNGSLPPQSPTKMHSKSKRYKAKPMWAMTEEEAFKTEQEHDELPPRPLARICSLPPLTTSATIATASFENDEDKELGELLSFVQNLDFEKYMTDWEVDQALNDIEEKVNVLESHAAQDNCCCPPDADYHCPPDTIPTTCEPQRTNSSPLVATESLRSPFPNLSLSRQGSFPQTRTRAASDAFPPRLLSTRESLSRSHSLRPDVSWNSSTSMQERELPSNVSSLKMAESLLQRLQKMRTVHSKASLAAVIEELNARTQKLKAKVGVMPPPSRATATADANKESNRRIPPLFKRPI